MFDKVKEFVDQNSDRNFFCDLLSQDLNALTADERDTVKNFFNDFNLY